MDRQKISRLFIDLDGVLYQGGHLIKGADQVVTWMNDEHIPHRFVTNTTSRPRSAIVENLHSLGIDVNDSDVLTPAIAASAWLNENAPGPVALFVPEVSQQDFPEIEKLSKNAEAGAAAVVIGDIGDEWTFSELNRAFRLLMSEPKPHLVALGMTRYWQTESGLQLDVAPFVKALEHATDCEAVVLGKPSRDFFDQALQSIGCDGSEVMMIGDDIAGDVQAAQRAGICGGLVKTGKFREKDLDANPPPDVVLDSIADLPDWWTRRGDC